jgi:hypothetical protein
LRSLMSDIGCIEALCRQLRATHKNLDDGQLGQAIERFLRAELLAHNIPAISRNYRVGEVEGECDLVVETPQTIIFGVKYGASIWNMARIPHCAP